ncbi:MAG TPA: hypothetical protein VEG38_16140 [Acidimicrobiia bacterium]|nr:hypothetical protein [Acidimicrobiia bacterium]
MVPRAVQDAGYTAVGLGVLALQQVQTRRRELSDKVSSELSAAGRQAQGVLSGVKSAAAPVATRLEGVPRLLGAVVDEGRARLAGALRP